MGLFWNRQRCLQCGCRQREIDSDKNGCAGTRSQVSPHDIKIVVFGKANVNELIEKLGPKWTSLICTLHSAGLQLLRSHLSLKTTKGLVNQEKYKEICEQLGLIHKGKLADLLGVSLGIASQPSHSEPEEQLSPHTATG